MMATPLPRESLFYVVKTLPAAPQILAQLGRLLLDMNSDLTDIADLLKRDAALTTRIIRISNCSLYNTGRPFGSLEEALARVGYTEVYRLTGFAAVAQLADEKLGFYGITGAQLRENALLTALIMEGLAHETRLDPRISYTAGLLRSIGKIALDRLTRDRAYSGSYAAQGSGPLAQWESSFIGMSNCEAAAMILGEWRFPHETINAIRDHYEPGAAADSLAHLLNLAAGAAEGCGHGLPGEASYWPPTAEKFALANIAEKNLREAVAYAMETFEAVRSAVA